MRIIFLNSSGNCGKSTLSRECFYPFMDNSKILEIETVNSSSSAYAGLNVEKLGELSDFSDVYYKILENENLIVDVGASVLSEFLSKLNEFAGIESIFDYFVIPCVAGDKVPTDTARTIKTLKENFGIENSKIKVIFNKTNNVKIDFDVLIRAGETIGYSFDTSLSIPDSSLFSKLGLLRKTIAEIYNEDVDAYKALILEAEPAQKAILLQQDLCNRMAVKIRPQLQSVYEAITGTKAILPKSTKDLAKSDKKKTEKAKEVAQTTQTAPAEIVASSDDEEL